jgi:hypothetical protein
LTAEDRHDLGQTEVRVADLESPRRLEALPEGAVVEAGLTAEEAEAEAERAGLRPISSRRAGYEGVQWMPVTPSSTIVSRSFRAWPTPKGTTAAPLASMIMWSVTPPVHSW